MTMEKVLEVKDLRISFDTFAGKVNAIRGVVLIFIKVKR